VLAAPRSSKRTSRRRHRKVSHELRLVPPVGWVMGRTPIEQMLSSWGRAPIEQMLSP